MGGCRRCVLQAVQKSHLPRVSWLSVPETTCAGSPATVRSGSNGLGYRPAPQEHRPETNLKGLPYPTASFRRPLLRFVQNSKILKMSKRRETSFFFFEKYNPSKSSVKGPSVSPAWLAVSPLPFSSHLHQRSHLRFTAQKRIHSILLHHWMLRCCATPRQTGRNSEDKSDM